MLPAGFIFFKLPNKYFTNLADRYMLFYFTLSKRTSCADDL